RGFEGGLDLHQLSSPAGGGGGRGRRGCKEGARDMRGGEKAANRVCGRGWVCSCWAGEGPHRTSGKVEGQGQINSQFVLTSEHTFATIRTCVRLGKGEPSASRSSRRKTSPRSPFATSAR